MASASLDTLEFTVEDRCVKTHEAGSDRTYKDASCKVRKQPDGEDMGSGMLEVGRGIEVASTLVYEKCMAV